MSNRFIRSISTLSGWIKRRSPTHSTRNAPHPDSARIHQWRIRLREIGITRATTNSTRTFRSSMSTGIRHRHTADGQVAGFRQKPSGKPPPAVPMKELIPWVMPLTKRARIMLASWGIRPDPEAILPAPVRMAFWIWLEMSGSGCSTGTTKISTAAHRTEIRPDRPLDDCASCGVGRGRMIPINFGQQIGTGMIRWSPRRRGDSAAWFLNRISRHPRSTRPRPGVRPHHDPGSR